MWRSAAPANCWRRPERPDDHRRLLALYGAAGKRRRRVEKRPRTVAGRSHQQPDRGRVAHAGAAAGRFYSRRHTRLSLYKRIASAKNDGELDGREGRADRPLRSTADAARNLLQCAALRLHAQKLGIKRIESNERGGFIEFGDNNRVDPGYLIGCCRAIRRFTA
ncbi:TRCF domain-containing protein [Serratia nematodiphila]